MDTIPLHPRLPSKSAFQRRHVSRSPPDSTSRDEVAALRAAPRAATLADLRQLSKLADDTLRGDVVERMRNGTSRTAAKAIKAATGRDARDARDPADQAYEALRAAYERAPIAARRRFRSFLLREGDGS